MIMLTGNTEFSIPLTSCTIQMCKLIFNVLYHNKERSIYAQKFKKSPRIYHGNKKKLLENCVYFFSCEYYAITSLFRQQHNSDFLNTNG